MAQQEMRYKDGDLATHLLANMNEHRAAGEFCDITLVVGKNTTQEISAHKLVLSSFSRYFQGLLKANMREGHQDRIEIHNLSGPVVKQLIDFAYTGKLDINIENIEEMFEAANYLAIESACCACSVFMERNLERENCVSVLRCAQLYGQNDLQRVAFHKALENFSFVVKRDEFYALPVEIVSEFLSSEYLGIRGKKLQQREKVVLDTVIKYVKKNHMEKSSDAVLLFQHVRLPLLKKDVLVDLQKSDLVLKNESIQEVMRIRSEVRARKVYDDTVDVWMRPRRHHGEE